MSYSFNHVHLKSSDPGSTAQWYVEAFGFKILEGPIRSDNGLAIAFIEAPDNVRIEVMQLP